MKTGHMVIVGGGVIGTACGFYLSKIGWRVTILERGTFGKQCSHGNCGYVCPSHVLPLAVPGAVPNALKSLFQKNSPFYIKPRFDPSLWLWLFRFARKCNQHDMMQSGKAISSLLNSSRQLYDDLVHREKIDCEWQTKGLLFVYRQQKEMDHYAEIDHLLRTRFDMPAKRFDEKELAQLEPSLKSGIAGGWLYESDAHLRPDRLMQSWRTRLEQLGGEIREQIEVQDFVQKSNHAIAVDTNQGRIEADAFVIAAGAMTPLLNKQIGCAIPIQPGKGYSLTMPRPANCPTIPMIFEEHRVAITPMNSTYRIGSTMEFSGYDDTLNQQRLNYLKSAAEVYLKEPYCEPVHEQWYGWRPMIYDGKPIIDRSPRMENVLVAAGHGMLGLSMATGTGKLVSELISGHEPHVDPKPFRIDRF